MKKFYFCLILSCVFVSLSSASNLIENYKHTDIDIFKSSSKPMTFSDAQIKINEFLNTFKKAIAKKGINKVSAMIGARWLKNEKLIPLLITEDISIFLKDGKVSMDDVYKNMTGIEFVKMQKYFTDIAYNEYLKNKKDMELNYFLVKVFVSFSKYSDTISTLCKRFYKDEDYKDEDSNQEEKYLSECKERFIKNTEGAKEYNDLLIDYQKSVEKYYNEILEFSKNYENIKLAKKTKTKGLCSNLGIEQSINVLLYFSANINQRCVYHFGGLKAIQVQGNKVLVSGYSNISNLHHGKNAIITTINKYVDGDTIHGYGYFAGNVSYNSIVGNRTVAHFVEVPTNEYHFILGPYFADTL